MSSLSAKDRVSLCRFTFADGRQCRTPRSAGHPHLCSDHARKESQARAAQSLGKDLAYFFSGDYLSACDLSSALGRLIPAVIRGDVKPRTARTVAYPAQTLLQAIHISQHEYCEPFDANDWRRAIRNSVKGNHDYLFPPVPKADQPASAPHPTAPTVGALNVAAGLQPGSLPPQPASVAHPTQTPVNCHSERSEESAFSESKAGPSQTTLAQQAAPSPRTPMPPTSAEFAQHVVVGIQPGMKSSPPLTRLKSTHTQPPVSVDSKTLT